MDVPPQWYDREADAKGGRAAEEAMARSTSLEALSYALFAVNGLYLVRSI
jgi:hypothetical protein